MILQNLHTHTLFCDGKNTAEELIEEAINLHFNSIGFSGHAYTSFDKSFCMSEINTKKYIKKILELKEKYNGIIDIFLGTERDYFSDTDTYPYDYVIGSLHYIKHNNKYLSVDESEKQMLENVYRYFNGNFMEYVSCYYNSLSEICHRTNCDIIGHFDLVSKFNEGNKYFDEDSDEYKEIVSNSLNKIAKAKPIFEINTGAISRKIKSAPYPCEFILKKIHMLGCNITISSDCHNKDYLDFGFKNAKSIAKKCGFENMMVLESDGFKKQKL